MYRDISDDISSMRATSRDSFSSVNNRTSHGLYTHTDSIKLRRWALMASGGFVTHIHHDANGLSTWVSVTVGAKLWTFFRCVHQEPSRIFQARKKLATFGHSDNPSCLQEDFELGTVLLTPGNVLCVTVPVLIAIYIDLCSHVLPCTVYNHPALSIRYTILSTPSQLGVTSSPPIPCILCTPPVYWRGSLIMSEPMLAMSALTGYWLG